MTAKASISLTDSQEAFARELVAKGRYASLSAVLQHGLELLRKQTETEEAELAVLKALEARARGPSDPAALKALLEERAKGPFISMEEGRARTRRMIAEFSERVLLDDDLQA